MTSEQATENKTQETLLFGVDSQVPSDVILQNNLTEFEWVSRNKLYPAYWGRNINGENALSVNEISFLHSKACKIAAIWLNTEPTNTEQHGKKCADDALLVASRLSIPKDTAIFLELAESNGITKGYLKRYAKEIQGAGYVAGFMANTDAKLDFDREFSRGIQADTDIFKKCVIWAKAPTLKEYDRITTTHLIKPDVWKPFAPSGTTRNDIAVWQYGRDCHPINDDNDLRTSFNINLIKHKKFIVDRMF